MRILRRCCFAAPCSQRWRWPPPLPLGLSHPAPARAVAGRRRFRSMAKWTASDLPDLHGLTFVVTGGNSGIGLVAARELGRAGARVVLAVRDTAKGERAAQSISGETEVRRLDLADLESVRDFAQSWSGDIDVLINNAGLMAVPQQRTKDGF